MSLLGSQTDMRSPGGLMNDTAISTNEWHEAAMIVSLLVQDHCQLTGIE